MGPVTAPAGTCAEIDVSSVKVNAPGVPANLTAVVPVKLRPVTITVSPAAPLVGSNPVMTGAGGGGPVGIGNGVAVAALASRARPRFLEPRQEAEVVVLGSVGHPCDDVRPDHRSHDVSAAVRRVLGRLVEGDDHRRTKRQERGTICESHASPSRMIWSLLPGHFPVADDPCMLWQLSGTTNEKSGRGFGNVVG